MLKVHRRVRFGKMNVFLLIFNYLFVFCYIDLFCSLLYNNSYQILLFGCKSLIMK
jgi:hypothetical protein